MTLATDLAASALDGDRRSLARLLTLIEDEPVSAADALGGLYARAGHARVVGITGPPGAGKSTLTNAVIERLRSRGEQVAVVAVDPTSPFTGGALLGDRIRMGDHAMDAGVFIRSMANRGELGGLAAAVPLAARLFDAVGYEWVLVETVGVGQVEVAIAGQADISVVVLTPGWGDHVQASKAGLLEIADAFVVNKADRPGAKSTLRDLRTEIALAGPTSRRPLLMLTEAHTGVGIDELTDALASLHEDYRDSGLLEARRRERLRAEIVRQAAALTILRVSGDVDGADLERLVDRVTAHQLSPADASRELASRSVGAAA